MSSVRCFLFTVAISGSLALWGCSQQSNRPSQGGPPTQSGVGSSQQDALDRRLQQVETINVSQSKELKKLQSRVDQLSQELSNSQRARNVTPTRTAPPSVAAWRLLKKGMTKPQVTQLLGTPSKINAGGVLDFWYYGLGSVSFSDDGVFGWSEP